MNEPLTQTTRYTLPKAVRLRGEKQIEDIFRHPHRQSLSAFPLRMVYTLAPHTDDSSAVQILISVPKRHLHHAVDRNRTKRQLREAIRRELPAIKQILAQQTPKQQLKAAILWQCEMLKETPQVQKCVKNIFQRFSEKL